ncbi:hypothetical protein EJB05_39614 [Eragrostis curvula]|uniref:Uncharacterized protein n=1 Tax=Eragrostis curvula TaxID=38414 RepID=A0A5J9SL18_9POAL|nr:hypothetical protein EJB05_54898 [Eragrostis curvula]TVU16066.1 hypothetical protein EJB05_39614 [Eragrostis curvula]
MIPVPHPREISGDIAHRLHRTIRARTIAFLTRLPRAHCVARTSRSEVGDQGCTLANQMRGAARFLAQSATKPIKPVNAQARMMTVTPQRHEKENSSSESAMTKDENVEPLVAFSRPPPLPPVLGPLVAFSFFQMLSGDDDKK